MKSTKYIIPFLVLTLLIPVGANNVIGEEMSDVKKQRLMVLFDNANITQEKIIKQEVKAAGASTLEIRNFHLAKIEKLKNNLENIDRKINKLAPITIEVSATSQVVEPQVVGESSSYPIVGQEQQGCNGYYQAYIASVQILAPTDASRWSIGYPNPISLGWAPICWNSSFATYEITIQNHSDGWACANNNLVPSTSTFDQICIGKIMNNGNFVSIRTIAHYSNWTVEHTKYIVV